MAVLLFSVLLKVSNSSTCSSSASSSNAITIQRYGFKVPSNTNADTYLYSLVQGPASNTFYHLNYILGYNFSYQQNVDKNYTFWTVVRRVNANDSEVWRTAIDQIPNYKSLVVDSNEQYVLFSNRQYCVIRLSAETGTFIDAKKL